jgi:hypothetical protein
MTDLKPGTPCRLVNLVRQKHLMGREVEVIGEHAPPAEAASRDAPSGSAWFECRAPWIASELPGQVFVTPAHCLAPILPGDER